MYQNPIVSVQYDVAILLALKSRSCQLLITDPCLINIRLDFAK